MPFALSYLIRASARVFDESAIRYRFAVELEHGRLFISIIERYAVETLILAATVLIVVRCARRKRWRCAPSISMRHPHPWQHPHGTLRFLSCCTLLITVVLPSKS